MAAKKTLSLLLSTKPQCVIWDNTAHVQISAPDNKCTAQKYKRKYAIWVTALFVFFRAALVRLNTSSLIA